jgi:hypothetical protein
MESQPMNQTVDRDPSSRRRSSAPRCLWLAVVLAATAVVVSGTALYFVLERPVSPGAPFYVAFSQTFIVGSASVCNQTFGYGYCSFFNFTIPGNPGEVHFTVTKVSLNQTCPPTGCSYEVNSYPSANRSYGYGDVLNRTSVAGGPLASGEGWIEVWQSRLCGPTPMSCVNPPVTVTLEVLDLGVVSS